MALASSPRGTQEAAQPQPMPKGQAKAKANERERARARVASHVPALALPTQPVQRDAGTKRPHRAGPGTLDSLLTEFANVLTDAGGLFGSTLHAPRPTSLSSCTVVFTALHGHHSLHGSFLAMSTLFYRKTTAFPLKFFRISAKVALSFLTTVAITFGLFFQNSNPYIDGYNAKLSLESETVRAETRRTLLPSADYRLHGPLRWTARLLCNSRPCSASSRTMNRCPFARTCPGSTDVPSPGYVKMLTNTSSPTVKKVSAKASFYGAGLPPNPTGCSTKQQYPGLVRSTAPRAAQRVATSTPCSPTPALGKLYQDTRSFSSGIAFIAIVLVSFA